MNDIKILMIDLDNTLYMPSVGLIEEIHRRVLAYVMQSFGLEKDVAYDKIIKWSEKYGSTLQGIIQTTDLDKMDYLNYIHDIDIDKYVFPNDKLKRLLNSINICKVLLTNTYRPFAERLLMRLNVYDCFDAIYSTEDMNYHYKNDINSLRIVIDRCIKEMHSYAYYNRVLLIDDNPESLDVAKIIGLKTMLISDSDAKESNYDFCATNIFEGIKQWKN